MLTCLWYTNVLNLSSLSWFWRCKEYPCPLSPGPCLSSPYLGLWMMPEVCGLGLASWSCLDLNTGFLYTHDPNFDCIQILKVQMTSMCFKSSVRALEDAAGFWLGFGTLNSILILLLVFDIPIIQILALYLDFEGAKNIHILYSLFRNLEDPRWSWLGFHILILIWSLVLDTLMFTILPLYLNFEGAKNLHIL